MVLYSFIFILVLSGVPLNEGKTFSFNNFDELNHYVTSIDKGSPSLTEISRDVLAVDLIFPLQNIRKQCKTGWIHFWRSWVVWASHIKRKCACLRQREHPYLACNVKNWTFAIVRIQSRLNSGEKFLENYCFTIVNSTISSIIGIS